MDGAAEAASAGLRYVSDQAPGIRRRRRGSSFQYLDPAGRVIREPAQLARIRALAIPPAYEDVWICPAANGHIQATGRDARGRKQYRYHSRWREVRDETKYARMLDFASALPGLRARIETDLAKAGMPREKVLAAVVQLLETTTIRVGNDEYAKHNDSYGLTTMKNRHATVSGSTVQFTFKGKSGIKHAVALQDRRLAKIVRSCQDIPGQELFGYLDDDGGAHDITSQDVNDYIREISGGDFTAKDFRTWVASVECTSLLRDTPLAETHADRKKTIVDAVKRVAERLGNTPAVCRKSYIHPEILNVYTDDGTLGAARTSKPIKGLLPEERFVVQLLKRRARETRGTR